MPSKVIDYLSGVHIRELTPGTIFQFPENSIAEYKQLFTKNSPYITGLYIVVNRKGQKNLNSNESSHVLAVSLKTGAVYWNNSTWTPDLEIIRHG